MPKKTALKTKSKKSSSKSINLLDAIVEGAQEKKARDIAILEIGETGSAIADQFVICHGDSGTQVDAIAHSIEDEVFKKTGERPVYREGFANAEWILLDYIDIVVHIFLKEQREYYGIERFWADAKTRLIA